MDRVCKCGGHLSFWVEIEGNEYFRGLFQCIDCGKDYLLKDGKYKFISKAEFRRIVGMRKNKTKED